MAIFPKDVVAAVKTALSSSSFLTYVDTVVVQKYSPEAMPQFTTYCIVINPVLAQAVQYPASQRWIHVDLELILLAKKGDRSEEDALLADSPPTNVGLLTMYEDIFQTLYDNDLSGAIEVYPEINELDNPANFNILTDEVGTFILEGAISYRPRGVRWVNLS